MRCGVRLDDSSWLRSLPFLRGLTLNKIEFFEAMFKLIDAGETSFAAFCALTKGDEGLKGVKRADFEVEYEQLASSPFLRKLKLRGAREEAFKDALVTAVMKSDPAEAEVMEIAELLTNSRTNHRLVSSLLDAVHGLIDTTELNDTYDKLWPSDVV